MRCVASSRVELRCHDRRRILRQDVETETSGLQRLTVPFPEPQFLGPYGATYGLADCIDCLDGKLDEPKNSG